VLAPATASRLSFSDAARRAIPAVVNISATREVKRRNPLLEDPAFQRFFGERFSLPNETQLSLGSGVIVSREGYILTNDHVVEGVSDIKVTLFDGRTVPGKIVGSDPDTDLAVVRINAAGLTPITFGLSEQARVGDIVLAIGDPFSVGQTVTMGIISAVGRELGPSTPFSNFIQTDAAINPGNSGGALVDTNGNLPSNGAEVPMSVTLPAVSQFLAVQEYPDARRAALLPVLACHLEPVRPEPP
jgi:serine protease DegQ